MAKDKPIEEYPDPPPTMMQTAMALTAGSLALIGSGIVLLLLWQLADCLHRLHLLLGLFDLAVGSILLWWTLSWHLPHCRRGLDEYRAAAQQERAALMEERRLMAEEKAKYRQGSAPPSS